MLLGTIGLFLGTEGLPKPRERSVFAAVYVYDFHLEEQSYAYLVIIQFKSLLFVIGQADFVDLSASSCRYVPSTHWTTLL